MDPRFEFSILDYLRSSSPQKLIINNQLINNWLIKANYRFEFTTSDCLRASFIDSNSFCLHIILEPMFFFDHADTLASKQFILAGLFSTREYENEVKEFHY